MAEDFYCFDPVRDHEGNLSIYHQRYTDDRDFTLNPELIKQLKLETCQETTPEGKALWLYMRLCQLLRFDEGYFYKRCRIHPNDEAQRSLEIAGKVTAETPTTCFNFSRIAVKLLNQIDGVHAVNIAEGVNRGHFRFGFYTDKVSIDAEATSAINHFNDLARLKLGLSPRGLYAFHGMDLAQELTQKIMPAMLLETRFDLQKCLSWALKAAFNPYSPELKIENLVDSLRKQNLDGASAVQLLFNLNRRFTQPPYRFLRAALREKTGEVQPQLLIHKNKKLSRLDLGKMELKDLSVEEYRDAFTRGNMVHADDEENCYFKFGWGLREM